MTISKLAILALISCSASAQNIDVGSAATGALITVLMRGVIAFGIFKLVTLNLTRQNIDTPLKTGRWIGAWFMGASILTHPSLHKSDMDFYIGTVIMAVVWFLIGFGIGFLWRKFKPLQQDISQPKDKQLDEKKKPSFRVVVLIAIILLVAIFGFWFISNTSSDKKFPTSDNFHSAKPIASKSTNAEWVYLDKDKIGDTNVNFYYDANSAVKISNSNYLVNFAYVFDTSIYLKNFDGIEKIENVKYVKRVIEFNCVEYKTKNIKSDVYGSSLSDSNQIRLNSQTKNEIDEFKDNIFAKKICPVITR